MNVELVAVVSYDECLRICKLMKESGFVMSGVYVGLATKSLDLDEMANVLYIALNHGKKRDFEDYLTSIIDGGGNLH